MPGIKPRLWDPPFIQHVADDEKLPFPKEIATTPIPEMDKVKLEPGLSIMRRQYFKNRRTSPYVDGIITEPKPVSEKPPKQFYQEETWKAVTPLELQTFVTGVSDIVPRGCIDIVEDEDDENELYRHPTMHRAKYSHLSFDPEHIYERRHRKMVPKDCFCGDYTDQQKTTLLHPDPQEPMAREFLAASRTQVTIASGHPEDEEVKPVTKSYHIVSDTLCLALYIFYLS